MITSVIISVISGIVGFVMGFTFCALVAMHSIQEQYKARYIPKNANSKRNP